MAPVYLSASRRLAFVFVLFLLFCLSVERVATLHIYDRAYLLSIRNLVTDVRVWNSCGQKPLESALLARLPANICCTPDCSLHRKKRHRKRGKRGGVLARLKKSTGVFVRRSESSAADDISLCLSPSRRYSSSSLAARYSSLHYVFPEHPESTLYCRTVRTRFHGETSRCQQCRARLESPPRGDSYHVSPFAETRTPAS
ncbi:unnamed protein product [Leuciscus chuanchicus]